MISKKLFVVILFLLLTLNFSACVQTEGPIENDGLQSGINTSPPNDTVSGTDGEQTTVHEHTASEAVKENEAAATCEAEGSYDEVIYCSECHGELSRTTKSVSKLSHSYKNGACIHCDALKTTEGLSYKSNGDGTCSLTGMGSCQDTDIIVPSVSPSGDIVTAVAASAFYNCVQLDSIRIPESVTSIGNNAFAFCANMRTVVLSNNITSWGNGVFAGCDNLQYKKSNGLSYIGSEQNPYLVLVDVNDKTGEAYEVNEQTVFVSNNAFSHCLNAKRIEIGEQVIGIGSCAFQNCSLLVSMTLPQNLTEINESLFSGCRALETVNIPSKVTVIKNNAFAFCISLKDIELPEGLKKMETAAFYFCSALTEMSVPNSVTEIQTDVFKDCSKLVSVILPDRITVISSSLFRNCNSLKSITIPSGVKEIEMQAFENCTSLENIVIPASVKTIMNNAFRNCPKLKGAQFEVSNGWQCFDVNILMVDSLDLSDTEQNALYLTFKYTEYKWKRQ